MGNKASVVESLLDAARLDLLFLFYKKAILSLSTVGQCGTVHASPLSFIFVEPRMTVTAAQYNLFFYVILRR